MRLEISPGHFRVGSLTAAAQEVLWGAACVLLTTGAVGQCPSSVQKESK